MASSTTKSNANDDDDKTKRLEILYQDFLSKLSQQVPLFLNGIQEKLLQFHNLDVSPYKADHVCWRTETLQEYSDLVAALNLAAAHGECTLLIESIIGGRPIATFSLSKGIQIVKNPSRTLYVLEIPAPKEGSPYSRGLEHVEFVIGKAMTETALMPKTPLNDDLHQSALETFMNNSPSITWDTRAKTKEINPDVSLKLDLELFGRCSVKFHLMPLADVIEYEKKNNNGSNIVMNLDKHQ